jgi:Carboxypeptidase regulatory-like domain
MPIRDHRSSASRRSLCLGIALLLSTGTPVAAQTAMATIRGCVVDGQNAVVPGVTISVLHLDTNATRVVVTTDLGDYVVPGLLPGLYQIVARCRRRDTCTA